MRYPSTVMGKRVAYQGIIGSFSSMAARALYGSDLDLLHTTRFRDIFEHVVNNRADVGVVPLENALAGSVHENYDLLQEYNCYIIAEYYCPVHLHLLALERSSTLTQVLSHPKALEQCSQFFERNPAIQPGVFSDTAGAALHVASTKDPSIGAIASEEAARTYGLTIVEHCVQNHQTNSTRFVAISSKPATLTTPNKCSIVVRLPHQPGSLYRLLGEIAALSVNVTKIESRPILGMPFEYAFHIDLQLIDNSTTHLTDTLSRVEQRASHYRLLGLYQHTDGASCRLAVNERC